MTAAEPLVAVENLRREFDVSPPWLDRVMSRLPKQHLVAVEDVSFSIHGGETYALVGESGSGKSTIARMLVGLMRPTSGRVAIGGVDLATADRQSLASVRRRVQMIFQDPFASMNPRWRVRDIIAEPIEAYGLEDGQAAVNRRVAQLLEQVGMSPALSNRYPHEFSGGQRQRICIARALASRPEFIVCDEPTSALDVSVQAQVLNLMRDLQRDLNLTYLFITHDLSVVRFMATRVGVLYLGRLVESADRQSIFNAPRHPYTRMLLEAAPELDGFDRQHAALTGEIPDPIDPPSGCHFHPRCPIAVSGCREQVPPRREVEGAEVLCLQAG